MSTRKLVMLANDFPPVGGAGVQRALYFAKYLPRFGWIPTVLTVKEVAFPAKDPSLLDQLPDETRVVRTESFELRRLLWLAGRLRALLPGRRARGDGGTKPAAAAFDSAAGRRELGRSLRRWLLVPDDRVLWAPFAVAAALRQIRKTGASAVLATVPAYSSGFIGALVARLGRVPFVLDLRDPWTRDPYLPAPTRFHAWLNRKMEAFAVRRAARVVVISEAMRVGFVRAYPELPPERIVTITNGYDVATFNAVEPFPRGTDEPHFILTYVGSLYAHHRPSLRAVCAAWSALAEHDPEFAGSSRLDLIGRCDPEILEELASWPQVHSLSFGYLPHAEGLRHLRGASALLLLIRDLDPENDLITIPGKLFEYLGAGPPILMVGPEGDAAGIVRETGGRVLRESDGEGIGEALVALFVASSRTPDVAAGAEARRTDDTVRARYDRQALTGRLAEELDRIAGKG